MTLTFKEIGRPRATWTEQHPNPTRESMLQSIRERGILASQDADVVETDDPTRFIVTVGGFRQVGKIEVQL